MAKPKTNIKEQDKQIHVSAFKDINIHFPGDVYLLAVWAAMSDRAKSSPTSRTHTTLHGLANKFASAYGTDYSNPISSADVLAIFHRHGIKGNPLLCLDDEGGPRVDTPHGEHDKMLFGKLQEISPQMSKNLNPANPKSQTGD